MSAYHLRKTEVIYELKIRNAPTDGNAGELRKHLTQCLASDTKVDDAIVNSMDAITELEECEGKYQDLSAIVSDYEGTYNDNEFHRIVARLWHLYLRVERIPIRATSDTDLVESKTRLLARSKELLDSFRVSTPLESHQVPKGSSVIRDPTQEHEGDSPTLLELPRSIDLPRGPTLTGDEEKWEEERKQMEEWRQREERKLQAERRHQEDWLRKEEKKLQDERRRQEERWHEEEVRLKEERLLQEKKWKMEETSLRDQLRSTEERERQFQEKAHYPGGRGLQGNVNRSEGLHIPGDVRNSSRPKYVPVYKWGLKFDNSSPISIAAFLERVEELRRARGVTHQELYESAVDLFAGSALVWYRAAANRITSWHQLTKELREVFQPADYDLRLHQEIFNRVQGDHEPIDLYIAALEGLYGRLAVTVPEATRLAQIYHNLHPQLRDRLALCNIQTLEQLRSMGRRAEAGRLSMIRTRPANSGERSLEPDLAYHDQSHRRGPTPGRVAGLQTPYSDRQDVTCWNCKEKGHRFRLCRKPKRRFCFGCGQENIFKKDCTHCCPKNGQGRESEKK